MSMGHECPHYLTISWYIVDIWPHSGVKIPRCTSLHADMYSFGIRTERRTSVTLYDAHPRYHVCFCYRAQCRSRDQTARASLWSARTSVRLPKWLFDIPKLKHKEGWCFLCLFNYIINKYDLNYILQLYNHILTLK